MDTNRKHMQSRSLAPMPSTLSNSRIELRDHEGCSVHHVHPDPVFHERRIAVDEGFVDVHDISLWADNERIRLHVEQFRANNGGKTPTSSDLVTLLQGDANLPGLTGSERELSFEIAALAQSIAQNGVLTPPILSHSGVLLDGNRRVAACLYVLAEDKFTPEQKDRARLIKVWRLTDRATTSDHERVVVARNFEPSHKKEWPAYVKARVLYEEWRALLANEDRPSANRQKILRRELAQRFALPNTGHVTRAIQMVEFANEFEEFHTEVRNRDSHEVKYRSTEYFQYFDELGKGASPGGVRWAMENNDDLKRLVFDLLHDRKFTSFRQMRALKFIVDDEDALKTLRAANDEDDLERAQDLVQDAVALGRAANVAERELNANKRVEMFVKWILQAPLRIFSSEYPGRIKPRNLQGLYRALTFVARHVPPDLRKEVDDENRNAIKDIDG